MTVTLIKNRGRPGWDFVLPLSGMVFHNFLRNNFFSGQTPTWSGTVIYWGFGPFWAAGTWRNSGPGPKTENRNFPELGGLLGGN